MSYSSVDRNNFLGGTYIQGGLISGGFITEVIFYLEVNGPITGGGVMGWRAKMGHYGIVFFISNHSVLKQDECAKYDVVLLKSFKLLTY